MALFKKVADRRILTIGIALAAAVLIFVLPTILGILTELWWFESLGLSEIYTTSLLAQVLIGIAVFVIVGGSLWLNLYIFRRLTGGSLLLASRRGEVIHQRDIGSMVYWIGLVAAFLVGLVSAMSLAAEWDTVLSFFYREPFGVADPVFGRDVGYYVFGLPFAEMVFGLIYFVLFISFAAMVVLYSAKGTLNFNKESGASELERHELGKSALTMSGAARRHLVSIVGIWFLVTVANIYLVRIPKLLLDPNGLFFGAGYTDIFAYLPYLYALMVVSAVGFVSSIAILRGGKLNLLFRTLVAYVAVAVIGAWIYPWIVQSIFVAPNELAKETPYLESHLDATREAWGIEDVSIKELSGNASLSARDIENNRTTIDNVRLWDRGPFLDTVSQLQEIRTYYNFISADTDRYLMDDGYRQISVAPRELDSESLPNKNFINSRLTFTHGMGAAAAPVNSVTGEGLPELFVKNLSPVSDREELAIERPEIYYGEMSSDWVLVNTKTKELDYPAGEENVYSNYAGSGGVRVGSLGGKLAFAVAFGAPKIALSSDITDDSRVMYHRRVAERVKNALPFLELDSDPYLVIREGRLTWIADAYTTSSYYPYSERARGDANYMRNSVKVTVDAYSGELHAYIADPSDPIISVYQRIFPNVFEPLSAMPESVRSHVRYPEDIFTVQTNLYAEYHMREPKIFYNKEDKWEIPRLAGSTRGESIGPVMRHLIMRLPGEEREEFVLMLPYTPSGKDNMSAWIAARSDGAHYGELVTYQFPKQELAFGPKQVVGRINQDAEISRQISLWDQRGSEVIQGNLYVIPIQESILYVRPLYLRAEQGRIPELKRVIVMHRGRIAMEPTLGAALSKVVSGSVEIKARERLEREAGVAAAESPSGSAEQGSSGLAGRALEHFRNAENALREGDWAAYGREIDALGEVLRELE